MAHKPSFIRNIGFLKNFIKGKSNTEEGERRRVLSATHATEDEEYESPRERSNSSPIVMGWTIVTRK